MLDNGSPCNPDICFGGDYDTGIYLDAPGSIGFALDGIAVDVDTFIDGLVQKRRIDPVVALVLRGLYHYAVQPRDRCVHCGF